MTRLSLAEQVLALDRAFDELPHAFGGALALAYYAEPRSTIDIDLNVFVGVDRLDDVAAALARVDVAIDEAIEPIRRDGQGRVHWNETPIDLFFAYDAFHGAAAAQRRTVPFSDAAIPILAPEHLVVCKVLFDRPKDWVDIAAMIALGTALDAAEVLRWVGRIAGDDDPRYDRIAAMLAR
jgi:nucleotidyltransferase AbiEii toxin of type IV toxin-antitoxin system